MATRAKATLSTRKAQVMSIYERSGAKLIEAHGSLPGTWARAPAGVVVIFIANPGQCMLISAGRMISRDYFGSDRAFRTFLNGRNVRLGIHHTDIANRTYLPGEMYPDVELSFGDDRFGSFGHVWRLPVRNRAVTTEGMMDEAAPTFSEVVTPRQKHMSLSSYLRRKRGIYIVNTCLTTKRMTSAAARTQTRPPANLPKSGYYGWKRKAPPMNATMRRLHTAGHLRPKLVYPRIQTSLPSPNLRENNNLLRKSRAPNSWSSVLSRIGNAPNKSFKKLVELLPTNTNISNLRYVYETLHDPRRAHSAYMKLNKFEQERFNTEPSDRGALMYKIYLAAIMKARA
jgi:hypothetical protein